MPNSFSRWRQPPQGVIRAIFSATTATSAILRSPAITMCAIAEVSAHQPSGKLAFSMLQPAKTLPLSRQDRRADGKLRIGRVSVPHGGARRLEKIGGFGHHRSLT